MSIATASDGFGLWYEAFGEGPAIVFLSKVPAEHLLLARALAEDFRVVLYEPRMFALAKFPEGSALLDGIEQLDLETLVHEAGADEASILQALMQRPAGYAAGRSVNWDPSGLTAYPIELDLADLNTVADAAGIDTFTLAGYSGTAAYAAMLAPYTDRATGLLAGGFALLDPCDYWIGMCEAGQKQSALDGELVNAALMNLACMLYEVLNSRDEAAAYSRIVGPKIVWFGSDDSEPGCWVHDTMRGAHVARRLRKRRCELEALGFSVIELPGQTHVSALLATDVAAPLIAKALSV